MEGKVSVNKLSRIASVVTQENESFWANQVKVLPKSAVETLIRDQKSTLVNTTKIEDQNDLFEPRNEPKSLPGRDS